MEIFSEMEKCNYEALFFCQDKEVGLKAIICIHNTALGPALGGTRMYPYQTEDEAIIDVLRLARGMTYKASAAGLDLGGGKAVIIGDPLKDKSKALLRVFGRFVDGLGGKYITAEDVGTNVEDAGIIRLMTRYVVGLPEDMGGSGDPSPVTAYGVLWGIKACAKEALGSDSLKGRVIAIQGIAGKVGRSLAKYLAQEGAVLIGSGGRNQETAKRTCQDLGASLVLPDDIYDTECDIFSPNAMGGILNDLTIPRLKCRIVAGGANNQLLEPRNGDMLYERKILYAPDYVINAGGLINVSHELDPRGYSQARALKDAQKIRERIKRVIQTAKKRRIPTYQAADRLAWERVEQANQKASIL